MPRHSLIIYRHISRFFLSSRSRSFFFSYTIFFSRATSSLHIVPEFERKPFFVFPRKERENERKEEERKKEREKKKREKSSFVISCFSADKNEKSEYK